MKTFKSTKYQAYLVNLFTLVLLSIFLSACEDDEVTPAIPITAQFTFSVDDENLLLVSFINNSENAESALWDFGDGETSEELNPTHEYSAEGEYSVTLIAANGEQSSEVTAKVTLDIPELYLDYLYVEVARQSNIIYGSDAGYNLVDFFEATSNDNENRPLVLLSPGGAFRRYNRMFDINSIAEDLAKRGYAVGVVRYHIDANIDLSNPSEVQTKWIEGIRDQKTAIRFFKKYATDYRIDPERIFIGGWSNGGQLAMTVATFTENDIPNIEDEAIRTSVSSLVEEMGGLEGSDHSEYSSSVRGALLMNIYSFDINSIDNNDPALMFIHHDESRLSTGDLTLGKFKISGSPTNEYYYGPNPIADKAMQEGFVMGDDLELIVHTGREYISTIPGLNYHEPNFAALSSLNYDQIAAFFHRNLE